MVIDSQGIRRYTVLIGWGLGYRVMESWGIRCDGFQRGCEVKGC